MAIIGTIQERGKYLLVGIVGLSLVLFIAQSAFDVLGTNTTVGTIGTIDGEPVDQQLYANKDNEVSNEDQMAAQQQGRQYDDMQRESSGDKAWNMLVDSLIMAKEYEALGLSVSKNEFNDYLFGNKGFTLMSDVAQNYTDPVTGKFKTQEFQKFLDSKESLKGQERADWIKIKERIKNARIQEKYNQILNQGMYVTTLEAKNEYHSQKEMKSISFIMRNYRDIPDEDIKITESEIKAFYEKHKEEKEYEVLAGRTIRYFDIALEPSKKDIKKFNRQMDSLKREFAASKDDSAFVINNSDAINEQGMKLFSDKFSFRVQGDQKAQPGLTYPAQMDTVFKTASIGQVVGPYDDNGAMRISKVIGFNNYSMKVRHILISAQKGDNAKIAKAKITADSIAKVVNKDNFTEFVTKFSQDPGSVEKGGVYEDFYDNEMVEPFAQFSMTKPVGTIGVVQTDFGFHIIEVMDRQNVKHPILAVVQKTLAPSEVTKQDTKAYATHLLSKINFKLKSKTDIIAKLNLFDTLAKKEEKYARPLTMVEEAPKASGFQTKIAQNAILKLAFNEDAQVGDLCGSPIYDKDRYIIAIVSSICEKGVPELEDCYAKMRVEAIKEKKAKRFTKEIGSTYNLKKLAKKFNLQVMSADVTFANPNIQGGGNGELEIVGKIFALKDKATTKALVGKSGVYVIVVKKTTKAPTAKNYDAERTQLLSMLKSQAVGQSRQALMKKLNVVDNRKLFDAGVYRD